MSPTLEHEGGSMNNYSETTMKPGLFQEYLDEWSTSSWSRSRGDRCLTHCLAHLFPLAGEKHFYFFERSHFSVLRIEFDKQTQLSRVRRDQFSLFCATMSHQFGPQSSRNMTSAWKMFSRINEGKTKKKKMVFAGHSVRG